MRKFIFFIFIISFFSCNNPQDDFSKKIKTKKISVFVSILPQKFFVEKIGGDMVNVSVMVQPGQSPATYEPTPRQMVRLGESLIYFTIGVPFETVWINKISESSKRISIIDTTKGIQRRNVASFEELKATVFNKSESEKNDCTRKHGTGSDPHIWLSPALVKKQAGIIMLALSKKDPANTKYYRNNLNKFIIELNNLEKNIVKSLSGLTNRKFLVFHPSWGYFADQFALKQIPVEIGGKGPSQKKLSEIINFVKKTKIKVIFIQQQFSTRSAEVIAEAIDGRVVVIDPLSEKYISNLRNIAEIIAKANR